MKIGVIGAGNWGKNLVRNFAEMGVLSGVADPVEENRNRAAEVVPSEQIHEDAGALIHGDCQAVAIATPVPTHFEIAAAALQAGKDVFVEKPMTLNSRDARELVRLAEENERVLMVGHLLLYQPPIRFIKKFLESGEIGQVYSLHQERKKLGRARYIENVTWSLGVHDLAVLLHLVDETPRFVFASGHCGLQEKVEDDVYVHIEFLGGVKAHLHNSWLWPENHRRLTIVGEKGMLVYDEVSGSVTLHRKGIDRDLNNWDEGSEVVFEGTEPPLRIELDHFVDCVENRKTPISDGRSGVEVVSLLERIMMF